MVDLKTELSSNQTILALMSNIGYNDSMIEVLKDLSGSICYVTANKTYDSLKETFEKNKIDTSNIIFIDAISKTIKKSPKSEESVYYVSSPGALTELNLVINKFLKHNFDYFIFDSITNLTIYNKAPVCAKFISSIVNNITKNKTKGIFYALGSKEDALTKHVSLFVNKVIDLQNGEEIKKDVKGGEK